VIQKLSHPWHKLLLISNNNIQWTSNVSIGMDTKMQNFLLFASYCNFDVWGISTNYQLGYQGEFTIFLNSG